MPSPLWPRGLLTPLLTPFRDDELDLDAFRRLFDRQVDAGAAAVVVAGGTGEYGMLTRDERIALAAAAAEHLDGRLPLIVQTGAPTTRDAIALSRHAELVGALGVMVASPVGEQLTWRERQRFYEDVHDAVGLPVMIYNTPPAGILTLAQIEVLVGLDRVTAIKDSSGDVTLDGDLLAWAAGRDVAVYLGTDSLVAFAGASGADGVLVGTGNVVPEPLIRTFSSARDGGDPGAAWPVLRAFLRFMEESTNYFALCKVGVRLDGIEAGSVRAPFLMPDRDERRVLTEQLDRVRRAFGAVPVSP
jgi:4-hydroxy-tetrahydrodipicolinate synthase